MYKKVNGKWQTVERTAVVEEKKKAVSSDLVQEMLKKSKEMLIRQEEMQRQEDLQAIEIELRRQRQQIAKGKKNVQKYSGPRKKKVKTEAAKKPVEYVNNAFIKDYTPEAELLQLLDSISEKFPDITKRETIGKSVEGRQLAGIVIGQGVRQGRPLLRPQVKYVANIHGDEAVGREMLLGLARYLTDNYGKDARVTAIVDTTEVHLIPSINPDGNEACSRHNANDEDLNRAFPGWRDMGLSRYAIFTGGFQLSFKKKWRGGALFKGGFQEQDNYQYEYEVRPREPEVQAMMNFILDNPFVLSISFHDGRVMVNYPWDDSPTAEEGHAAVCPDDAVFSELAALYAEWHTFMWTGKCLCHSETFDKGISNGAEWYLVDNGMQDFNYLFSNCLEITVELSCTKKPPPTNLQAEWENNLDPLLALLESVHGGVKGRVVDQDGEVLPEAAIKVAGIEKDMVTTSRGEYWRLLMPGTYHIRAVHTQPWGTLESEEIEVEVTEALGKGALVLDFVCRIKLEAAFVVTGVKVGGCRFFDMKYLPEVEALFDECRVTKTELHDAECRRVPNDPVNRQVAFLVNTVMKPLPMYNFFEERWGESVIRRPINGFEADKLTRRTRLYAMDRYAGRKGEWNVRLA